MKIQINNMLAAADEASALLKALANRHRLIIICQLSEKERSVGELAELLNIRDSTVSQHLALLRKDGLVTGGAMGRPFGIRLAALRRASSWAPSIGPIARLPRRVPGKCGARRRATRASHQINDHVPDPRDTITVRSFR